MVLSCGMDDAQEQDQYEERLREVFNSFDASGCGSLCLDELSELCQSLHLDDATPALLQTLLQDQDHVTARVDFDQFKNALILVLSSTLQPQQTEEEEEEEEEEQTLSKPESPEIQPKFVKGSKRYGRRSTPEFIEPISDPADVGSPNLVEEENAEDSYDLAIPRKRERWNAQETSTEEYEAEGQMHLWNPDEPSTPRKCSVALSAGVEERLREACDALAIAWDGCAGHSELLSLCEHLGLELSVDVLQGLSADGLMNVQEFVSRVVNHNKPPTPSASTPYRQLKRLHSTQPFDEEGRRIATPSALTSSIGMRLFSTLDDGTGFTPAEYVLDAWVEEGIENSAEILQALNFSLDGKLSLSDLTMALENELLVSKSGIHRAAVASFKAEIRSLLEQVDRELREKEKIRSDLEKAEKLKTQLATEVDEHHNAIEQMNNLNLRKLEQDHKEKLAAVRSELMKELDQLQQQAGLQREELEAEVHKIREDESFLRDHLSISVKENRRLEMELLDSAEKLMEAQNQITKLQMCLDNIMKERFGDLDPSCADLFLQEERFKQLRCSYEAQYRELQDRIDELQSELQEFHSLGRGNQTCNKPLSEELESKSPGMESDPGIGSEDVQPFSMSLEAEMMLEQLKEQHLQEMEELRNQLETKINEFDKIVEKQKSTHEEQKAALVLQYQQEVQALKEELTDVQSHTEDLQSQLEQAELEKTRVEQAQTMEREELENLQEEEVGKLRQQLAEAHDHTAELEEQLKTLEAQQAGLGEETEEARKRHDIEIEKLREEQEKLSEDRLEEEKQKLQEEKAELEKRCEREKEQLQQDHEDELKSRLDEAKAKFEEERDEIVQRLTEQWQKEKTQLDEQNNESLQLLLEEEMMKLIREQEEKEAALREQWESERAELRQRQEEALLDRAALERSQLQEQFEQKEKKLREEWERERLQLEEDYEGMLQERLNEERARFDTEREEEEKRLEAVMAEEKERLEERHQEAMKELSARHCEERDALSSTLDKLREEIAQERKEIEINFSQRIHEVEDRFSGDQESMAKRFQADVLKLEQHYQSELKRLSEDHEEQKLRWEAQMQEALEKAEEQTRAMEEKVVREREKLGLQWQKEREEMESVHKQEIQELVIKNRQLQHELDDFISGAQTKEIELSRQLNDLHGRLQESLQTKDELLAESENKALEMELLLNQTVEDFKQEREELLNIQSELEGKSSEMFSMSERQIAERIELLTERDDLKVKIEELEKLLKQAAVDFELERNDLQEHIAGLEEDCKGSDREELMAERDELRDRIKELEAQLSSVLSSVEKAQTEECEQDSKCSVTTDVCPENIDSSDQGLVSMSPFVTDKDVDAQMITEDADARESENENVVLGNIQEEKADDTENSGRSLESKQEVEEVPKVCEDPESPSSDGSDPETEAFSQDKQRDAISSLEALEGVETDENGGNQAAHESCEEDNKPQDVPSFDGESRDEPHHETVADPSLPQEMCDLGSVDAEVECLPNSSQEVERFAAEIKDERSHDSTETPDEDADCEDRSCSLLRLQALLKAATEENVLLHEKISLLQQKAEILENLLVHNGEKVKAGHLILEENYSLKVKMLVLMEHVKELEVKALKMTDLQIRYEDCVCENAKLKEQNSDLEKRVWSLESRLMNVPVVDELDVMKISELLGEMERRPALLHLDGRQCDGTDAASVDVQDVQVRCEEFEKENSSLRRAITELQDESETLSETTKAHRSEISRLAEENLILRQKLDALKEEDMREAQQELMERLEHLNKGKMAAQKAVENFKKQISDLRLQSQQLVDENKMLSEKDAQNMADIQTLRQELAELTRDSERREEAFPAEERNELAACVSALETELTKALEDTAQLEERNNQLSQQLCEVREKAVRVDSLESHVTQLVEERKTVAQGLRDQRDMAEEKVKTLDETLQAVNHQSVLLKSSLCVLQHERDSLKHDVAVLQKQLQNVKDKNQVLEKTLRSSGENLSKRRHRDELGRLAEQDQQLLKQENEKLQAEVRDMKEDLVQSREKVRQLDATVLSLKQHKQQSQSSLVKALEQENTSLKQELEAQRELTKACEAGQGHTDLETLQQENEALKTQMARLSTQLLETLQAQLVGLLPPSPHRMPRGPHRGDEPDNVQDERERKMKNMEERMREIELSLHNVKLLLREKVSQLKEQLHKNGKADVLIKDLYVENSQLLKALEITEQRQKIAEKKNYLLEEKISSLNKIVRDLSPSPLSSPTYHFKCS